MHYILATETSSSPQFLNENDDSIWWSYHIGNTYTLDYARWWLKNFRFKSKHNIDNWNGIEIKIVAVLI